jgi:hypothetical protein
MAKFFKEQPEIEFPQELIDLGFEDNSWRNDAGGFAWHPQKLISVFCAEEIPEQREFPSYYRYIVSKTEDDGYPMQETLFQSESIDKVVKFLKPLLGK